LTALGFGIVARNWRRPEGELDLVAEDAGTCVFVEVRSRTGELFGHPLEAVGWRKRGRVIRAALLYLQSQTSPSAGYRFDVVGVLFPTDGGDPTCHHVADAFRVGEG
jgi:putative endonuclease